MAKDMNDARKLYADMKKRNAGKKKAKANKTEDGKTDNADIETPQQEVTEQSQNHQDLQETQETTETQVPTVSKDDIEERTSKVEETDIEPKTESEEVKVNVNTPKENTEKESVLTVHENVANDKELEVPESDEVSATSDVHLESKTGTPALEQADDDLDSTREHSESSSESERILDELLSGATLSDPHDNICDVANSDELDNSLRDSVISSIESNPDNQVCELPVCQPKSVPLQRLEEEISDKANETVETSQLNNSAAFNNLVAENNELKLRINVLEQQVSRLKRQLNEAQQEQLEISVTAPPSSSNILNIPSASHTSKDAHRTRASSFVEADLTSGNEAGVNDLEAFRDFKLDLRDWHVSKGEGPVITV